MIRRLEQLEAPASDAGSARTVEGRLEQWLTLVASLLPEPWRGSELREEIETHLRERVRDLLLAGSSEEHAIQQAVGEFGDAATFARRYIDLNRSHRRRLFMQTMCTGIGVLAVAGATWLAAGAMNPATPPPSVFRSAAAPAAPADFEWSPVTADQVPLASVFEALGKGANGRMVIRWGALEAGGLERDLAIDAAITGGTLDAALRELRTVLESFSDELLDWRFTDDRVVIATRCWFDERERELVRYDIGLLVHEALVGEEELRELLSSFASPDDWEDNGGTLARMRIVSNHLFVEAPPRIHERVQWLLDELRGGHPLSENTRQVLPSAGEALSMTLKPGDALSIEINGVRHDGVIGPDGALILPSGRRVPFLERAADSVDTLDVDWSLLSPC